MIALKNCTDWGFPARLRMLGVVVMLVGIAVSGQKACAQFTPCDSGYIAAADTFLFQYDRRCCAVVFHSCIKLGEIKFSGLDFDQSCFDFDVNTAPSIYAAVVQRGFEIALYNHVGTITGNAVLPACPQTSSWTMKTVAATCGAWWRYLTVTKTRFRFDATSSLVHLRHASRLVWLVLAQYKMHVVMRSHTFISIARTNHLLQIAKERVPLGYVLIYVQCHSSTKHYEDYDAYFTSSNDHCISRCCLVFCTTSFGTGNLDRN